MTLHMLTTDDNPFDPFVQYEEWDNWDQTHGYHSAALLGRVVATSYDISEPDQDQAMEDAISDIIKYNLSGHHIRVSKSSASV